MTRKTILQRFEEKYIPVTESGCWLWEGHLTPKGYGQLYNSKTKQADYAHRISYELHKGQILNEVVDHLCGLRCCVNPEHLQSISNGENTRKSTLKTLCSRGHLFNTTNTYRRPDDGTKQCKECKREARRRWWKKRGKPVEQPA